VKQAYPVSKRPRLDTWLGNQPPHSAQHRRHHHLACGIIMEGLCGAEETLYIKCLFKTISFHDVHEELKKRINYTGSDSYYTMTLKLRLDILCKASCSVKMQDELKSEICGLQMKVPLGYNCSVTGCKYNTKNYNKLLIHLKMLHSSGGLRLVCQLKGCERELSSLKMLHLHLRSSHRTRKSTVVIKQSQLAEQMIKLKCQSVACGHQMFKTLKDLKVHLVKDHTEKKEEIQCIFAGCDFLSNKTGTLRSHFTRKHPTHMVNDLKNNITVASEEYEGNVGVIDLDVQLNDEEVSDEFYTELDHHEATIEEPFEDDQVFDEIDSCSKEVFTRALAMQFNSWMNVKNIAYSTVNSIVSEVFNSYEQGVNTTKERIKLILSEDGWDKVKIDDLLSKIDLNDPFKQAREELEKEEKRIRYIQNEFEFAQPRTIRLSETSTAPLATMQYIPIKESLKIFLEDPTFLKQKNEDPFYHEPGVVKDVKDSENFRNNKFFEENPTAIPLIIFQDELEVSFLI
jgi:hypothetical protein